MHQSPQNHGQPFALLDETAIAAAKVWNDPYHFAFVERAISPQYKRTVLSDAPNIHDGRYGRLDLRYGPGFGAIIDDLLSPRFRRLIERKFYVDLAPYSPAIMMTGNSDGRYDRGYTRPDSKHTIIIVLLGFTADWPHDGARLRVLRSADREDFAFAFAPVFGRMLMFRPSNHCWHGVLPQSDRGTSLHLCYVDSERFVRHELWRHSMSPSAQSVPILRQAIEWAPR